MGVTIVVASGDDGAHSKEARSTPSECGYTVSFPASSKYVVAVGATSGPETSTAEVACQADKGIFTQLYTYIYEYG
jgi:subtilase family serine protease